MCAKVVQDFHDSFETITRLGHGAEGLVLLGHDKVKGKLVAMKKIECMGVHNLGNLESRIKRLMHLPDHSNIMKHHEYYIQNFETKEIFKTQQSIRGSGRIAPSMIQLDNLQKLYYICIVMEFCNAGTLDQVLRTTKFRQKDAVEWVHQMVKGLQVLHDANIIHRDIKPDNIFYHDTSVSDRIETGLWTPKKADKILVKIGDFGLLKVLESKLAKTQVGTICYMSPEILTDYGHDQSSDIWSLGILILLLLLTLENRKRNHETNSEQLSKLRSQLIVNQGQKNLKIRLQLYKRFTGRRGNQKLCILMFECLRFSPEQRPTAGELVEFIEGNKKYLKIDPLKVEASEGKVFDGFVTEKTGSSHLDTLKSPLAKTFWKNYFGEYTFRVDWRTFSGAYQNQFKRLGIPKTRGLKKILCGSKSSIVTIFHLRDCINILGFPFHQRILEKIERYMIGHCDFDEENEVEIPIIDSPESSELGRNMYITLNKEYEVKIRDDHFNDIMDLEKDYVPTLPQYEEIIQTKSPVRLFVVGMPFSGKTLFLRSLRYEFVKRGKDIIPIYIDCSKLSQNYEKGENFFIQCIRALPLYRYNVNIEQFLYQSYIEKKVLLLFDGIHDIFSPELKEVIYTGIMKIDLVLRGSRSGIIMTSRIPIKLFEERGFSLLYLPMLNTEQQEKIIKANSLSTGYVGEQLEAFSPNIRRVPLFLKMTLDLFRSKKGIHKKGFGMGILPDEVMKENSIKKEVMSYKNIFSYETSVTREIVEKVVDICISKFESVIFDQEQALRFLTQLGWYLMFNRRTSFTEEDVEGDELELIRGDFYHARDFIVEGQFDFLTYNEEEDTFEFTYIELQYFFASMVLLRDLRIECYEYEAEKRKKVLRILRKKTKLSLLLQLRSCLIDPWFILLLEHTFLQLKTNEAKIYLKTLLRMPQMSTFLSTMLISIILIKRNSKENEEKVLYNPIRLLLLKSKKRVQLISKELCWGLSHPDPYIRFFARYKLNIPLRRCGLMKFENIYNSYLINPKIDFDGTYFGHSLRTTLNLKQRQEMINRLVPLLIKLCSSSNYEMNNLVLRYLQILRVVLTKKPQNEIQYYELKNLCFRLALEHPELYLFDCSLLLLKLDEFINEKDHPNYYRWVRPVGEDMKEGKSKNKKKKKKKRSKVKKKKYKKLSNLFQKDTHGEIEEALHFVKKSGSKKNVRNSISKGKRDSGATVYFRGSFRSSIASFLPSDEEGGQNEQGEESNLPTNVKEAMKLMESLCEEGESDLPQTLTTSLKEMQAPSSGNPYASKQRVISNMKHIKSEPNVGFLNKNNNNNNNSNNNNNNNNSNQKSGSLTKIVALEEVEEEEVEGEGDSEEEEEENVILPKHENESNQEVQENGSLSEEEGEKPTTTADSDPHQNGDRLSVEKIEDLTLLEKLDDIDEMSERLQKIITEIETLQQQQRQHEAATKNKKKKKQQQQQTPNEKSHYTPILEWEFAKGRLFVLCKNLLQQNHPVLDGLDYQEGVKLLDDKLKIHIFQILKFIAQQNLDKMTMDRMDAFAGSVILLLSKELNRSHTPDRSSQSYRVVKYALETISEVIIELMGTPFFDTQLCAVLNLFLQFFIKVPLYSDVIVSQVCRISLLCSQESIIFNGLYNRFLQTLLSQFCDKSFHADYIILALYYMGYQKFFC